MKALTAIIASLILITGCRPATEVTASWRDTEREAGPYNSVFLAAIVDNRNLRQTIEMEFADRLSGRNVTTATSSETFRPTFFDEGQPDREQLVEMIHETGKESILTITLIDEEREERFVPGGPAGPRFHPGGTFGYYGTFPGYFDHWYGRAWNTGYYATDRRYIMETNLYDAESLELVWSAQSTTLNPGTEANFARQYVDALKAELREEGFIR